jgi:beta-phosphoglucomutase-like phosphatase (HAD superfamily)
MTRRARREDQPRILADALARAAAAPAGAVAVFDLDSTILDNRPRQARILRDYGAKAGLAPLLEARPEHWQSWEIERAMIAAGLAADAARRHRPAAFRFWAERFFTTAYCRLDEAIPGAPAFVRAVAAAGPAIAYVTGRPAAMETGTLEVLARFGFPPPGAGGARLLLKPDAGLGDDAWKALAVAEVDRLGPVALAFDNEPAHANAYARAWPAALVVHLDRGDSGRPVPLLAGIPSIEDFQRGDRATAASEDATAAGR